MDTQGEILIWDKYNSEQDVVPILRVKKFTESFFWATSLSTTFSATKEGKKELETWY